MYRKKAKPWKRPKPRHIKRYGSGVYYSKTAIRRMARRMKQLGFR